MDRKRDLAIFPQVYSGVLILTVKATATRCAKSAALTAAVSGKPARTHQERITGLPDKLRRIG